MLRRWLVGFSLLAAGCQAILGIESPSPAPSSEADAGPLEDRFSFAIGPSEVTLPLGASNLVAVTVTRRAGFTGPVEVAILEPEAGITSVPLTLAEGEATGTVQVGASAPLTIGSMHTVQLQATAVDGSALAKKDQFNGVVTGTPGTLDLDFAGTGFVIDPDLGDGHWNDVECQADGRINVGGVAAGRISLGAYNAAGAAQLSQSKLLSTCGGCAEDAVGLRIGHLRGGQGRIVVGGFTSPVGVNSHDIALVSTFFDGSGATAALSNPFESDEQAFGMAVQTDDRIVLAGGFDGTWLVVRFDSVTGKDTSFGPGGAGHATVSFNGAIRAVAVDPIGRIVVAGSGEVSDSGDFAVAVLTASGAADTSFGSGGKASAGNFASSEDATDLVLLPSGRILVAGHTDVNGNQDVMLAQFTGAGLIDAGFGATGDGEVITRLSGADDTVAAVELMPDGRFLIVGHTSDPAGPGPGPFIARYLGDGRLDQTFGTAGVVRLGATLGAGARLFGADLDVDGRLVVAGGVGSAPQKSVVARFWN